MSSFLAGILFPFPVADLLLDLLPLLPLLSAEPPPLPPPPPPRLPLLAGRPRSFFLPVVVTSSSCSDNVASSVAGSRWMWIISKARDSRSACVFHEWHKGSVRFLQCATLRFRMAINGNSTRFEARNYQTRTARTVGMWSGFVVRDRMRRKNWGATSLTFSGDFLHASVPPLDTRALPLHNDGKYVFPWGKCRPWKVRVDRAWPHSFLMACASHDRSYVNTAGPAKVFRAGDNGRGVK